MLTRIEKINKQSLRLAATIIKEGGIVAFPTETVYGLGANAYDAAAVRSVFAAKGRPSDNPLIVHVHSDYDISSLVNCEYGYAEDLKKKFTPGPLTMVYKSRGKVAAEVSCGLDTLAVRIPSNEGAQRFLKEVDLPIAAPSANASKHVSPVSASHVADDLGGKIPLILDGGRCEGGIESTVLLVTEKTPVILRSGLVTREMIKSVAGSCDVAVLKEGERAISPGMKYRHYAPRCKSKIFPQGSWEEAASEYKNALKRGLNPIILCDSENANRLKGLKIFDLGASGEEQAHSLFEALRTAEREADYIIGIALSEEGVGAGVMNRFSKALAEEDK